jgi:hypothetical protein
MAVQSAVRSGPSIVVPGFEVYGVGDRNHETPFRYKGTVGDEIVGLGERFYGLHKGSMALRDQAALFEWYLWAELGKAPEMPEEPRGLIYRLFNQPGTRTVTDDAVDYNHGADLKKPEHGDYRSVKWIVHPAGFSRIGGWTAIIGKNSYVKDVLIPGPGYVERTVDGAYRPDTGTPWSTSPKKAVAAKSWTRRGFSPEFARMASSMFLCRKEGEGTAAVGRSCNDPRDGPFTINAYLRPDGLESLTGKLPARQAD